MFSGTQSSSSTLRRNRRRARPRPCRTVSLRRQLRAKRGMLREDCIDKGVRLRARDGTLRCGNEGGTGDGRPSRDDCLHIVAHTGCQRGWCKRSRRGRGCKGRAGVGRRFGGRDNARRCGVRRVGGRSVLVGAERHLKCTDVGLSLLNLGADLLAGGTLEDILGWWQAAGVRRRKGHCQHFLGLRCGRNGAGALLSDGGSGYGGGAGGALIRGRDLRDYTSRCDLRRLVLAYHHRR